MSLKKKVLGALLLAALALSLIPAGATASFPVEGGEKVVLKVEGMTCGGCAARLEKVLTRLDGVATAKADYENGKVTITCTSKVPDEELTRIVTKAGFKLTGIDRS